METNMSIKTKIAALAIASLTVIGGMAASSTDAQAKWKGHHHGHGIGYGIAAGALLGVGLAGAAYAAGPSYAYDYRRCRWVAQYDQFGNYMGRTRACSYPVY
jgi:hypothetical protein